MCKNRSMRYKICYTLLWNIPKKQLLGFLIYPGPRLLPSTSIWKAWRTKAWSSSMTACSSTSQFVQTIFMSKSDKIAVLWFTCRKVMCSQNIEHDNTSSFMLILKILICEYVIFVHLLQAIYYFVPILSR